MGGGIFQSSQDIAGASIWTPFGITWPYVGNASDAVIDVNSAMSSPMMIYKNLTINAGIVLTGYASPQIVICSQLEFKSAASQISMNGLGGVGGAQTVGGQGAMELVYNGTSLQNDTMLARSLKKGGIGGSGAAVGADGVSGALALSPISAWFLFQIRCKGGGGGGGGAGAAAGASGAPGVAGTSGQAGSGAGGSGGGSGVGGGGGGGGVATNTGTGGTGGAGGGMLLLICDSIITASGVISANGLDGSVGITAAGGGGGGGGGLVLLYVNTPNVVPTLQANGGAGGVGVGTTGYAGGVGGAGATFMMRAA